MSDWKDDIEKGKRFEFGKNWTSFLKVLDDERIAMARAALEKKLNCQSLAGQTFLDIGCGSGLHSLCARMMGAKVHSFDFDDYSVNCTKYLKEKYFKDDANWQVEQGSILDSSYIQSLGSFDIVYSWGVLHHTGEMWKALELAEIPVKKNGILFIAIYNYQPRWTTYWTFVKRTYNRYFLARKFWQLYYLVYFTTRGVIKDLLFLKNPLQRYKDYKKQRGMSIHHDLFDWLGGYPFEVARPEEIFYFYKQRGYVLTELKTAEGTVGCNEFVFQKVN